MIIFQRSKLNFGLFVRVIHDLQVTTLVRFHSFGAEVYIYTDVNDLVYNDAPMTVRNTAFCFPSSMIDVAVKK